jgi:hypothetical protein
VPFLSEQELGILAARAEKAGPRMTVYQTIECDRCGARIKKGEDGADKFALLKIPRPVAGSDASRTEMECWKDAEVHLCIPCHMAFRRFWLRVDEKMAVNA